MVSTCLCICSSSGRRIYNNIQIALPLTTPGGAPPPLLQHTVRNFIYMYTSLSSRPFPFHAHFNYVYAANIRSNELVCFECLPHAHNENTHCFECLPQAHNETRTGRGRPGTEATCIQRLYIIIQASRTCFLILSQADCEPWQFSGP